MYNLSFRIDFYENWSEIKKFDIPKEPFDYDKYWGNIKAKSDFELSERKKLYNSLGLKLYSHAWAYTPLNFEIASKILDLINQLEANKIGYLGSGSISETIEDSNDNQESWFRIFSDYNDNYREFSLGSDYPICKAYKYKNTLHIQNKHYVSELFKNCIEKNNLTGLEFLWVKDIGGYQSSQWFSAIAKEPLGHGLDHAWFDRGNYIKQSIENDKLKPDPISNNLMRFDRVFSNGCWYFNNTNFKESWSTGTKIYDQLISRFPKETSLGFSFACVPRVQRKYLPKTDFAYMWSRVDGPNYEGKFVRERDLYISNRAKKILLENFLITEKNIGKVIVLDEVPEGVIDLDLNSICPPPVYTDNEFLALKKLEAKYLLDFAKTIKKIRKPTIKSSLEKLKLEKNKRPDDFESGINITKINKYFESSTNKYPLLWNEILRITKGGYFDSDREYYINPIESWSKNHDEIVSFLYSNDQDYNGNMVYFGNTANGDYLAFKKIESEVVNDCTILRISHEDESIFTEWNSIADFLHAILNLD